MPEINPLSNEQIFLKKIAENTGSDYETGDVSEINPLTIDQILLKEIAANTAGQSGDITELETKVADNTSAIEAMVEVNGCCNVLDLSNPSIVSDGVTFTVNSDGSVTANGTATTKSFIVFKNAATDRDMVVVGASDGVHIIAQPYGHSWEIVDEGIIHGINQNGFALQVDAGVTVNNVTVYPMLYDARLNPTGYVPYSMTNRELTELNPSQTSANDLTLIRIGRVRLLHFEGPANVITGETIAQEDRPSSNITSTAIVSNASGQYHRMGALIVGANGALTAYAAPNYDAQANMDNISSSSTTYLFGDVVWFV